MADSGNWGPTSEWIWFFIPYYIFIAAMVLTPLILVGILILKNRKNRKKSHSQG